MSLPLILKISYFYINFNYKAYSPSFIRNILFIYKDLWYKLTKYIQILGEKENMKVISKNLSLAIATIVLAVIVGFSSLILSIILDLAEKYFLNFEENNQMPVDLLVGPSHRFISVFIGSVIAAIVWYLLQRHYKPVAISKGIEGKQMPLAKTLIHTVTQIFYVGTGNSIGRELAPREAGAAIAQKWEQVVDHNHYLHLTDEDKKMLIACAAGAGFSGVYIAPITGAVFAIEILYKKVNARVVAVSLTMSVIATLIGSIVKGYKPYYLVGSKNFPSLRILPIVIILAPLLGILGAYFKMGVKKASAHRAVTKNVLYQLPIMGAITGLIAAFYPQIMGNGRGLAQLAMNTTTINKGVIGALLFGLVTKALVTLFSIKSGAYGGILTPSISLGAVIGVFLGMVYIQIMPGVTLTQCAVLGAAYFLTASQQAPLMAMFMLFEVCHLNFTAFIPLALGDALSISVSRWLNARHAK